MVDLKKIRYMWVARDKDGELYLYSDKPERYNTDEPFWGIPKSQTIEKDNEFRTFILPSILFPDLKWENEPVEVGLTKIKSKEKVVNWQYKHFDDAKDVCEFLNKHQLKREDVLFGKSGVGSSYTILYNSKEILW